MKAKGGEGITAINHGQILPECYASAADIIVNAENDLRPLQELEAWGWEGCMTGDDFGKTRALA